MCNTHVAMTFADGVQISGKRKSCKLDRTGVFRVRVWTVRREILKVVVVELSRRIIELKMFG